MKTLQTSAPTDMALTEALQTLGLYPVRLERRPHAYSSSFPIEELTIQCANGSMLEIIFKDLDRGRLIRAAIEARPEFLYDPMREIHLYEQVLSPNGLGARLYGIAVEPTFNRYWLFLERIKGIELHQFGEIEVWCAAARWLANFHTRFAGSDLRLPDSLLVQEPHSDLRWLRRALAFHTADDLSEGTRALNRVAATYDLLMGRLAMQPRTLLHGEFYSTNILIEQSDKPHVVPVDWENAAIGPALLDLAALIAGPWPETGRLAIIRAYHEALPEHAATEFTRFLEDLAWCRLRLAIQWLGWSPTWQPPAEKHHNWLGDVITLVEELDL